MLFRSACLGDTAAPTAWGRRPPSKWVPPALVSSQLLPHLAPTSQGLHRHTQDPTTLSVDVRSRGCLGRVIRLAPAPTIPRAPALHHTPTPSSPPPVWTQLTHEAPPPVAAAAAWGPPSSQPLARPASRTAAAPRSPPPVHSTAFPLPQALIRPGPGRPGQTDPVRLALAHGAPAPAPKGWSQGLAALPPQPPGLSLGTGPRPCCPRRPEPGSGPPARLPGPHRLRCLWAPRCPPLPWRLARIPQCTQGVARGEKAALPQPDRTEAGEGVGPLPAGCILAPRSAPPAPPDRAWSRQSGRQASPLQRCPCTLPPLRPGTRGSPGRPARAPCPHLPAAGQMLRARGLAPRRLSARPPRPRSPRLREIGRAHV